MLLFREPLEVARTGWRRGVSEGYGMRTSNNTPRYDADSRLIHNYMAIRDNTRTRTQQYARERGSVSTRRWAGVFSRTRVLVLDAQAAEEESSRIGPPVVHARTSSLLSRELLNNAVSKGVYVRTGTYRRREAGACVHIDAKAVGVVKRVKRVVRGTQRRDLT